MVLLVVPGAVNQFTELAALGSPPRGRPRVGAHGRATYRSSLVGLIDTAGACSYRQRAGPEPDQLIALGLTFAEMVVSFIAVLTMVYFWLTERARLQRFALALLPADRRAGAREAWNEIEDRLGAWVRGQLILMGSVGVATTIAYFLIGLEARCCWA